MTIKHAIYTLLCLLFWTTTAAAAGYYLDIEETDDVRDPIEALRLTCAGVNEREAVFFVGNNGFFIPQTFYLVFLNDSFGEPETVLLWNATTTYEIDLSQASTTEIFDALNDTLPTLDTADEEWYNALRQHILFNSNSMNSCQNSLFQSVAKYIQLTNAETPFKAKLALMALVDHLSGVDINCFDPNPPNPFEP